jgi:hypothetical protein
MIRYFWWGGRWKWIEKRVGKESAACCGVNLAAHGILWFFPEGE